MDSFEMPTPWLATLMLVALAISAILYGLQRLTTTVILIARNRALQQRNDSLSDTLIQVVQLASEERLALTLKHAEEREKLRTECMLQLDSAHRTTTASFNQLLLQKLSESRQASQTGSEASTQ